MFVLQRPQRQFVSVARMRSTAGRLVRRPAADTTSKGEQSCEVWRFGSCWHRARIMEVIHGVRNDNFLGDWMVDVWVDTQALGYREVAEGLSEPPVMFQDEPDLLTWWEQGQSVYWEMMEMAECPGCNDGTGNPLPVPWMRCQARRRGPKGRAAPASLAGAASARPVAAWSSRGCAWRSQTSAPLRRSERTGTTDFDARTCWPALRLRPR